MYRVSVSAWRKLKKIVPFIALVALLFASFQSGVLVGEKNTEEKEESYKINENRLKQATELEKERLKSTIYNLRNQIASLETNIAELKDKLSLADQRYDKLVLRLQEMTTSFRTLKESNNKTVTKNRKLEKILYSNRPFLDYTMKVNSNGGVGFIVYNKSKIPLKIVETDYLCWENGIKGNKHPGVKSTILYPDKNTVTFSFSPSPNNMLKVKSGEINFRGGLCTKYTTLDKNDNRYWFYEIWFIYDSTNKVYNVVRAIDNRASSKKQCNVEKMIPNGWFKH